MAFQTVVRISLLVRQPFFTGLNEVVKTYQDRQCAYNVPIEARSCNNCYSGKAVSTTYCGRVWGHSYPACNARAPYCNLWPALLYSVFPLYLVNGTIFGKKFLNTKCVFWFLLQLLSERVLNLRITERDMVKNVYYSSCEVPFILLRLYWNLNFLDSFFEKFSNIKFHGNPYSGRGVLCGRTGGHTWRC